MSATEMVSTQHPGEATRRPLSYSPALIVLAFSIYSSPKLDDVKIQDDYVLHITPQGGKVVVLAVASVAAYAHSFLYLCISCTHHSPIHDTCTYIRCTGINHRHCSLPGIKSSVTKRLALHMMFVRHNLFVSTPPHVCVSSYSSRYTERYLPRRTASAHYR